MYSRPAARNPRPSPKLLRKCRPEDSAIPTACLPGRITDGPSTSRSLDRTTCPRARTMVTVLEVQTAHEALSHAQALAMAWPSWTAAPVLAPQNDQVGLAMTSQSLPHSST